MPMRRFALLAALPICVGDGAVPCSKTKTCGGNFNVLPDDERLRYEGFVHLNLLRERAQPDRAPFGPEKSDTRLSSPGARISFSTNAHRVQAFFEYHGRSKCLPDCPRLPDDSCYKPQGASCPNQCEILLEVDGERRAVPAHTNLVGQSINHIDRQRDYQGEVRVVLNDGAANATGGGIGPRPRTYTLLLPWGAAVDLKRIHLEHPVGTEARPTVYALPPSAPTPKLVAYGDSSVAGWCAVTGYPHELAALNGWASVNVGIAGARIVPEDGAALGALGGQLLTLHLGASEWDACEAADVADAFGSLVRGVRAVQPKVPIVAVTPTLSWREGQPCVGPAATTPQDTRAQIGRAVEAARAAGDASLYLVDGRSLVPAAYLADGLHPSPHGVKEIAANLNAAMGFSPLQFDVVRCPKLALSVSGASPNARLLVYHGVAAAASVVPPGSACEGRALMLEPQGHVEATADEGGRATVVVSGVSTFAACHAAVFEVLDLGSCANSRLGRVSEDAAGVAGTPAEWWASSLKAAGIACTPWG